MSELLTFQFDPVEFSKLADLEAGCPIGVGGWLVEAKREAEQKALVVWIKSIRKKVDLPRTEFAKLFQVRPKTVKAWEAGRKRPSGPARRIYGLIEADPEGTRIRLGQLTEGKPLSQR